MSKAKLIEYGLSCVASFRIRNDRFEIDVTDWNIVNLERCIYALLAGEKILRIGSSKAVLSSRLKRWERDVTNALQKRRSQTREDEAQLWKKAVSERTDCLIYARQATLVTTPIGEFRAYMDEESVLIGRFKPCLNNHTNR